MPPNPLHAEIRGTLIKLGYRVAVAFLGSLTRCTENKTEGAAPPVDALLSGASCAGCPYSVHHEDCLTVGRGWTR